MVFGCIGELDLIIWPSKTKSFDISYKALLNKNSCIKKTIAKYQEILIEKYETLENFKIKIKKTKDFFNKNEDLMLFHKKNDEIKTEKMPNDKDFDLFFKEKKENEKKFIQIYKKNDHNRDKKYLSMRNFGNYSESKGGSPLKSRKKSNNFILKPKNFRIFEKETLKLNKLKIYLNNNVYFIK